MSRWANSNRHSVASHTLSPSFAGTLELKTEKQNAHSGTIWSVGFNKDGSQIVSGSSDKTIKVWDSGASNGHSDPPLAPNSHRALLPSSSATLELKAEKPSAHSNWVTSVAFSPDGKTIVSGSDDATIKVWDAGER